MPLNNDLPSEHDQTSDRAGWKEIDIDMLAFVERYANNPLKWEIVMFFGRNPHTRDLADHIARLVGRSEPAVRRELEDLALLGLLKRQPAPGANIYGLTDDPALRETLTRFVASLERAAR